VSANLRFANQAEGIHHGSDKPLLQEQNISQQVSARGDFRKLLVQRTKGRSLSVIDRQLEL